MAAVRFELLTTDALTRARLGRLLTPHGVVETEGEREINLISARSASLSKVRPSTQLRVSPSSMVWSTGLENVASRLRL